MSFREKDGKKIDMHGVGVEHIDKKSRSVKKEQEWLGHWHKIYMKRWAE